MGEKNNFSTDLWELKRRHDVLQVKFSLGGWQLATQIFFSEFFTPKFWGNDSQLDYYIFFNWVGEKPPTESLQIFWRISVGWAQELTKKQEVSRCALSLYRNVFWPKSVVPMFCPTKHPTSLISHQYIDINYSIIR